MSKGFVGVVRGVGGVILRLVRTRLFSAENLLTRLLQVFFSEVDLVIYKEKC